MSKILTDTVFNTYTPESCYWAGFLAADGSIDINGTISMELGGKDSYHVYSFKEYCGAGHEVCHNTIRDSYRIRFCSNILKDSLYYNFAITVNKTFSLQYPLLEESWQYAAYHRGFFDGDGCLTEFFTNRPMASYRVYLTSGSLEFLESTLTHLRELGVIKGGSIQKKAANCWHIQLAVKDAASYLTWIYSIEGPKLSRKYDKYTDIIVLGNRKHV